MTRVSAVNDTMAMNRAPPKTAAPTPPAEASEEEAHAAEELSHRSEPTSRGGRGIRPRRAPPDRLRALSSPPGDGAAPPLSAPDGEPYADPRIAGPPRRAPPRRHRRDTP